MVGSPMDRAAAAIDAMESENAKVTVTAVRSRAGVSMETARSAVEAWRAQRSRPVVAVTEAAQQAFFRLWAVAVTEARHTA
ncbi:DNA-binding protein [Paeniglutamicibacter psychrophenolicus]|uniref:DNA-binding protein n=1 Tax=Paeniglutamicibacter psychrophenolicus TaxID=257454 RepID=UPI0027D80321|nr:DNA-binding protein [Paeniglutamicibacter psychrophenolicus]